jgi:hypothetical protein
VLFQIDVFKRVCWFSIFFLSFLGLYNFSAQQVFMPVQLTIFSSFITVGLRKIPILDEREHIYWGYTPTYKNRFFSLTDLEKLGKMQAKEFYEASLVPLTTANIEGDRLRALVTTLKNDQKNLRSVVDALTTDPLHLTDALRLRETVDAVTIREIQEFLFLRDEASVGYPENFYETSKVF